MKENLTFPDTLNGGAGWFLPDLPLSKRRTKMRRQKEQVAVAETVVETGNGKQKLTEEVVRQIGELADGALTADEIAAKVGELAVAKVKGVIRNLQKHGAKVSWKKASKNTVYAKVASELK
mgnify:FL=1